MDVNKKPNIHLEGHELFFNALTGNWAFRPIKGFSAKYLRKDTFVPRETAEKVLSGKTSETGGKGKNASLGKARSRKNDEFYRIFNDEKIGYVGAIHKHYPIYDKR